MIIFEITPHYDRGDQCGGSVRCPLCGVRKDFVSNKAMGSWQTLHESSPGLWALPGLGRSVDIGKPLAYTHVMSKFAEQIDRDIASAEQHDITKALEGFIDFTSGDGYWCPDHGTACGRFCDQRRWGRYGAAGILFLHRDSEGVERFFLAQRSPLIHFGGTWGIPGGALDLDESPEAGARREVTEELGIGDKGRVAAEFSDGVEGWAYTTVVIEVDDLFTPERFDWETIGFGWFTVQEMSTLKLHPVFRRSFWKVVKAWMEVR